MHNQAKVKSGDCSKSLN